MQKFFIIAGIILVIIGITWPWLSRIPMGKLPGDIIISRPNFKVFFPITTMIILSIVLSIILWLLRK